LEYKNAGSDTNSLNSLLNSIDLKSLKTQLTIYSPTMSESTNAPKTTFHGSCHCKTVTYTVTTALPSPRVVSRCNCSVCHKTGIVNLSVSKEDFTLNSPRSESELSDYKWRTEKNHRLFCAKCGVQVFAHGVYEFEGNVINYFTVNALTLDTEEGGEGKAGQEDVDLTKWTVKYWDGKQDNWMAGQGEKPFKGGIV
jgi:hypothetical protein